MTDKVFCHPCFKWGKEVEAVTADDVLGWPLCEECEGVLIDARESGKPFPGYNVEGKALAPDHPWHVEETLH